MRFSVRTCNPAVIYIGMYKFETPEYVTDESFESLWIISWAQSHAQKFVESERGGNSCFRDIVYCYLEVERFSEKQLYFLK